MKTHPFTVAETISLPSAALRLFVVALLFWASSPRVLPSDFGKALVGFNDEAYTRVTFDGLVVFPGESERELYLICIEGYVGNEGTNDGEKMALWERRPEKLPVDWKTAKKILHVDEIYSLPLKRAFFKRKVRVFGLYYLRASLLGHQVIGELIRIDSVTVLKDD